MVLFYINGIVMWNKLNLVEKVMEGEDMYVKSLMGNREIKILGILWNKVYDMLNIDFKRCLKVDKLLIKRKIIFIINIIYVVLGWSFLVIIIVKFIFSEVCFLKLYWDFEVFVEI